ncbi:MAG: amidohydrolase family protein [Gammaproteobacteria bacterium]|jgi:predicted TIM-barrel fold metal-dependent hydrolase|nr:amidohydrolase family protein [Gammaproteobacteria bacterium]MBT3735878.1 amidohydrolase family protein [Gammaproteobacteria bacterium]MBT3898391.1 amidohydrolase family protein [Gammaproteobacteria bacterium]MBT7541903.1 amidohydrolase family protein [Gammaproteobacteria bacterium]
MTMTSPHVTDRVIRDADSHIVEPPGWFENYASSHVLENTSKGILGSDLPLFKKLVERGAQRVAGEHADVTEAMKQDLYGHRERMTQWTAFGAYDSTERVESLDIVGISSQLVFPGVNLGRVRTKDLDVRYGAAEALNRGMVDFCGADDRLLGVGFLPFDDPTTTLESAKRDIERGIKAFMIPTDAINGRSPAHVDYHPIWALLEEAGVPITLHIGSGKQFTAVYMETGEKRELNNPISNVESTKPHDLPVLHHSIERWLTAMIYFGVLEKFPKLMIGIIELGSNWVPATLMNLDIGSSALGRFDVTLQNLSMKPSEFFRRQVRVAPLHMEDSGWVLKNVGPEILMFNTDYPHPEGGRDPFGAFQRSLDAAGATSEELDRFYSRNFEELMGL